ncbi:hypothetical protein [uncultured Chryseobacterium sp.]|uniref:hypothetical protein n=1 Tax=uncultured Chryseobacterium sp. TaxID=259322 RepID=UPI0025D704B8|nr:hypothetical protein [uncultured Chryseobacterium sp.]
MENEKLRVNLTVGELELLFDLLKKNGTDEALEISDKLTTTNYIVKKTPFDNNTRFAPLDIVVSIISAVVKKHPSTIRLESNLFNIGVRPPFIIGRLRARLNQYILSTGSRSYLMDNDVANSTTVGELYQLVLTKIRQS